MCAFTFVLLTHSPDGKQDLSAAKGNGNNGNGTILTATSQTQLSSNGGSSDSGTEPKWPIKPGVHLHVNGLHSLGKCAKPINGFSYGTKNSTSTLPTPSKMSSPTKHSQSGIASLFCYMLWIVKLQFRGTHLLKMYVKQFLLCGT